MHASKNNRLQMERKSLKPLGEVTHHVVLVGVHLPCVCNKDVAAGTTILPYELGFFFWFLSRNHQFG